MTQVIPAIIPKSFQLLRSEMGQVSELVERVQVDIMDGQFAPESTWPYNEGREVARFDEIVAQKRGFPHWKDLQFELDMMVDSPEAVLDEWIQTGASAIIIHADSTKKHKEIFAKLREAGVERGLAVLPSNRNSVVDRLRDDIDFLQVMGNDKIGYHGVELDPLVYDKLEDLRSRFPDLPIGVDIGVNLDTACELVAAGATRLISGSTIFESEDKEATIKQLENIGS